jgi:hypothetical protein
VTEVSVRVDVGLGIGVDVEEGKEVSQPNVDIICINTADSAALSKTGGGVGYTSGLIE